ncbi:aminotransferase class V-fold PLP-dependent enzyme [Gaopeijia maritima]|uniref:aminotransferase class V-fold PLP-dependent enzyme n=1 Tax=Gaopeijia maritima TaxID=3119007 RepID=UPI003254C44C
MTTRREFLRRAGVASAAPLLLSGCEAPGAAGAPEGPAPSSLPLPAPPSGAPAQVASDENWWREVAARYAVTDAVTNMEAGFFGMMASPVLAAYHAHIDRVNRASSYYARTEYGADARAARERTAQALGVDAGEIAFTRNATEALQALILQFRGVEAGDTVMYADLDYPAMQQAMNALAERRGAEVATFDIPEPASRDGLLAAYEAALDAHPRTRLLLVTHANNKTGLVHPVREITAMAEARGAEVIVDAAHSFGQLPLALPDLGAAFVGVNLHKWVGAPVGVGLFYIRADRLDAIAPAPGEASALDRIDSRVHTGTTSFPAILTVPDALDFQDSIGVERKAARLRYLRDAWVGPAREIDGVDILTPDDPDLVGAITSFRLRGDGSREGNLEVARRLLEEHGIFTVYRTGVAAGDCVRVTPSLYNTPADAERLVEALAVLARG